MLSRRASALRASAPCSAVVASRSAWAWAMRASRGTAAAGGGGGARTRRPAVALRQGGVADVAGGVVDLLHLERVHDQAELLHLRARRLAGQGGELLAVADHLLDGHVADDRPQVAGEHVVDLGVHLLLLVE